MPNFSNAPPKTDHGPAIRLLRTPALGKLVAIVTCNQLIGCPTHFYRMRTIPCEPPNCEPCSKGLPWRWHGYITAIDQKTNEHFLFEFTAQAAECFTEYCTRHGSLRGCLFEAKRLGEHQNGRVLIRCRPTDLAGKNLPNAPDLIATLCHIWNVEKPDLEIDGQMKGNGRIRLNRKSESETRTESQQPTKK